MGRTGEARDYQSSEAWSIFFRSVSSPVISLSVCPYISLERHCLVYRTQKVSKSRRFQRHKLLEAQNGWVSLKNCLSVGGPATRQAAPYCKLNIPAETGWKVKECGEIHRLDIKPMTCIWILSVAAAIAGCNSPNIIANFFRSAMTFTAR